MNRVELIGRLTKDPEITYTKSDEPICVAHYTLAVDRRVRGGDKEADFIRCVAFGKSGEFVEKYLSKGMKIAVAGSIKTGSYKDKDDKTIYTTEVLVNEHEFCESKGNSSSGKTFNGGDNDFINTDGSDSGLPFNF